SRALLVERHREVQCALRSIDRGFLVDRCVVIMIQRGETVLDLLKRADDDAAVIRRRCLELSAGLGHLCAAQAAVKHAEQGVWSNSPKRTRRAQPVRKAGALEAALTSEHECWEIRRTRDAYIGIGRDHASLRGCDIGAAL